MVIKLLYSVGPSFNLKYFKYHFELYKYAPKLAILSTNTFYNFRSLSISIMYFCFRLCDRAAIVTF